MTIRVGVVGVGNFGQRHAEVYARMPEVELVALVDSNSEQARSVARKLGTRALGEHTDLIGQVDAVNIVTPTRTHYELAKDFLGEGVPVLTEKPITETVDQAKELVKLAQKNSTLLQVGHIERFNPVIMAIDGFDISPKFIEAHRLHPFSFRAQDVGVVLDLMIHDIDIILHLARSKLKRVDACGFAIIGENEDIANARLTFKDGCVANVTASRVTVKRMRKVRVFSPYSYISLDYEHRQGYIYKLAPEFSLEALATKVGAIHSIDDLKDVDFGDLVTRREIRMDDHDPLTKELESFIDAVKNEHEPVVTGEHGLRALEAATQILKSIRSHTWRDIQRPAPLISHEMIENDSK